ncbi:MAG TPA: hypothetical protein VND21_03600 [Planctomycetota bacterium]|nr:hypothetical protein [Planctomycetota bacterium]
MVSPKLKESTASAVARALNRVLLAVPSSREVDAADPTSRARHLRTLAARKAAGISTGLSLAPGPAGMLTVLPDLMAIWRVQSSLVADIASAYGKSGALTQESMVYCLFKHGGAALLRDLVVRVGERAVIRRASLRLMQELLGKIGVRVTARVVGRAASRWIPIAGAVGIGAYAYYDTKKVGDNAIELFSAARIEVAPHEAGRTTVAS